MIRESLRTSDLQKAMAVRDIRERADNELWASYLVGSDSEAALARYKATVARAIALGFTYKSAADIVAVEPSRTVIERIKAVAKEPAGSPKSDAVLGMAKGSDQTITAAFETYVDEIARDEIRGKSPAQKHAWRIRKEGSVKAFVELCGNKTMGDITRDDALKFYQHFMDKVAPKAGRPTLSVNMANRQVGNLRVLFREWNEYHGNRDALNAFAGLTFTEKKNGKQKRRRPPFSVDWIANKLLAKGALAGLNAEARGVFLTLIETGARLSEICNLKPENIVLDADVPHICIEPSDDPEDPREIKTGSSVREVPLVGIALAAMRKHKKGFPRYRDKGNSLSAALNKFLTENELLETGKHTAYSLRHSFEDRMKDAAINDDMRRELMGHTIARPEYGEGYSLKKKQEALNLIALPFDSSIV